MKHKNYFMKQCELERMNNGHLEVTITWLPEQFAKPFKIISLQDSRHDWQRGWKVKQVYHHRRSLEECEKRSRDHRNQRKCSDI